MTIFQKKTLSAGGIDVVTYGRLRPAGASVERR